MAQRNFSYTYRGPIRISEPDLQLVRDGKKCCTIRKGSVDVSNPLTSVASRSAVIPISVERLENIRFDALTERHAAAEGFTTVEELRRDLRKYYPDLNSESVLTVIWFRVRDISER